MKYEVIGWVNYDAELPIGELSDAACQAIIDDIREHHYLFNGNDHHWRDFCTPVLNDGKKRVFSQRSWGGIMAEAHGRFGPMDYADYAFVTFEDDDNSVYPTLAYDKGDVKSISKRRDHYQFCSSAFEDGFKDTLERGLLVLPDLPELANIDKGDIVEFQIGYTAYEAKVKKVSRQWMLLGYDFPSLNVMSMYPTPEEEEALREIEEKKKRLLFIYLGKVETKKL